MIPLSHFSADWEKWDTPNLGFQTPAQANHLGCWEQGEQICSTRVKTLITHSGAKVRDYGRQPKLPSVGASQQLKRVSIFEQARSSIHRPSRGIAECNQLSRRILCRRQRCLWILRHDRQHLSASHPLNGQALTLHRHYPVLFVKDFPMIDIHNALGCSYPTRRLQVNSQKISLPPLDNH